MIKRIFIIIAFFALLVQFGNAQKVAFVNIDEALSNTVRGKDILNKTKVYGDSVRTVFDAKSKSLQTLFTEYQQKMGTASDEEKAKLENSINEANNEVQYIKNNFNAIVAARRDSLLQPVAELASTCIKEIGGRESYDAIVDIQAMLFNKNWIDISSAVTQCIDGK